MEDTTSLFNYRDPRSLMADRYASQYRPVSGSPQEMIVQTAANAGSLIGNALFGGRTSEMAEQAVLNEAIKESEAAEDPDERLKLFAASLRRRGLEGYAQKAEMQLLNRQKAMAEIGANEALAQQRSREAAAKVSAFGQQLIDAGLKPGSQEYQAQMRRYVEKELQPKKGIGEQVVDALGATGFLERKDVDAIVTQTRQELNPYRELERTTNSLFTLMEVDNPKAGPQIDRALATLSGDKQLSMAEVQAVANAGPFGQQIADSVNRFFVGGSGELSKQQKKEVVVALAVTNVAGHNRKREELIRSYGLTGASKDVLNRAVGEEATLPSNIMKTVVEKSGQKFEPEKYVYRISPTGAVQRKPKGK